MERDRIGEAIYMVFAAGFAAAVLLLVVLAVITLFSMAAGIGATFIREGVPGWVSSLFSA